MKKLKKIIEVIREEVSPGMVIAVIQGLVGRWFMDHDIDRGYYLTVAMLFSCSFMYLWEGVKAEWEARGEFKSNLGGVSNAQELLRESPGAGQEREGLPPLQRNRARIIHDPSGRVSPNNFLS